MLGRRFFGGALLATSLLLMSCAPAASDPTPSPTRASSSAPDQVSGPIVSPFDEGPTYPSVSVDGSTFLQLASATPPNYMLRWPQLPNAAALNAAMTKYAEDTLKEYLDEQGDADTGAALRVSADIVAYTTKLAATRAVTLFPTGAKGMIKHATLYGDTAGEWVATSSELIEASKRPEFTAQVIAQVKSKLPEGSRQDATPERVLTDLMVNAEGGFTVTIDQGAIASLDASTVVATFTASQMENFVSDKGRQVLTELRAQPSVAPSSPSPAPSNQPPVQPANPAGGPDCATLKCVALTFDDGPGQYTNQLLDDLKAANVRATFFMLGQNAKGNPAAVRRAAAEGHAIANHTYDHRSLRKLDQDKQQWEIKTTHDILAPLSGQPVNMLRPPYGEYNKTTQTLGLPIIMWDVDTEDWKNRNVQTTTQRALSGAKPGSIILMHDIHQTSVQAVPGIIKGLKEKGYTLVTVPQLLGTMEPGKIYFQR